jgi:protein-S-isoprenylcysteine O-methyltransferase Ste14
MHHHGMFDIAFIGMYLLLALIRAPRDLHNKQARHVESRKGPLEHLCLLLVFTGSTTMPVLYLFTSWFDFADFAPDPRLGWLGVLSGAAGLVLLHITHRDLGHEFSQTLELKEGHRLVTTGIYGRIRHPMYTALFLIAAAQLLLIGNAVVAPAFLIAFTILYAARIGPEERMMLDHFGPAYADYRRRTGRLLPALRKTRAAAPGSQG